MKKLALFVAASTSLAFAAPVFACPGHSAEAGTETKTVEKKADAKPTTIAKSDKAVDKDAKAKEAKTPAKAPAPAAKPEKVSQN